MQWVKGNRGIIHKRIDPPVCVFEYAGLGHYSGKYTGNISMFVTIVHIVPHGQGDQGFMCRMAIRHRHENGLPDFGAPFCILTHY
jgi:hypothetical protein